MEEGTFICACPPGAAPPWRGLVDPDSELLLELDAGDAVVGGFPHVSALAQAAVCGGGPLERLFAPEVARRLHDGAEMVRRGSAPITLDLFEPSARVRIAARDGGVWLLLRQVDEDIAFWQL